MEQSILSKTRVNIKNLGYLIAILACSVVFSSCRNFDRHMQIFVNDWFGPGDFKGYATVYKYSTFEGEYVRESSGNAVYEVEEGYCIEDEYGTWELEELDEPIDPYPPYDGKGILFRYKFGIFYIEDIPQSY